MSADWSDDNADPSAELLDVLKENINSFDNEQVETFVSAIANLSVDVDEPALEALLGSKELAGALVGKVLDESLQIQFASLQAVNKLVGIAVARRKERLVETAFNLNYLQAAVQQKVAQNVSRVAEAVRSGLAGSFLADLKRVAQINSLCLQSLERAAAVLGDRARFAYLPTILSALEQLTEALAAVGEDCDSGKAVAKLIKRTLQFMLFVFEFEPQTWKSLLESPRSQQAVLTLMKGSGGLKFEAFKVADFGPRNGLSSTPGQLAECHWAITKEAVEGCERSLSLTAEKTLYSQRPAELKELLLLVREIEYLVEGQSPETAKAASPIASLGTFQFVGQLLSGALAELTAPAEEQEKQDRLLLKVAEETSTALNALVQFVDSSGIAVNQSFWTELAGFYESVLPKLAMLAEEDPSRTIECATAVFRAFSFIFESKLSKNASLLKSAQQTAAASVGLLAEVTEFIGERSASTEPLFVGEEVVAEELSGLLFDLTASLLDPSNIGKFESAEALESLLKTVHWLTSQKSQSLMVLAQMLDGLMTLFSDSNLDGQFFGNGNWALNYLTAARQAMSAFFKESRERIDSEKQEYCEEVLDNLKAFIKFKGDSVAAPK